MSPRLSGQLRLRPHRRRRPKPPHLGRSRPQLGGPPGPASDRRPIRNRRAPLPGWIRSRRGAPGRHPGHGEGDRRRRLPLLQPRPLRGHRRAERRKGQEPLPETLQFRPQDWEVLARRFLKSLDSDTERRWIERLALTPPFDEAAARATFSAQPSVAQDAEWEILPDYSFVVPLPGASPWFAIRAQMRWALENQRSASPRVKKDHEWWRNWNEVASISEGAVFACRSLTPQDLCRVAGPR